MMLLCSSPPTTANCRAASCPSANPLQGPVISGKEQETDKYANKIQGNMQDANNVQQEKSCAGDIRQKSPTQRDAPAPRPTRSYPWKQQIQATSIQSTHHSLSCPSLLPLICYLCLVQQIEETRCQVHNNALIGQRSRHTVERCRVTHRLALGALTLHETSSLLFALVLNNNFEISN
jgi:hypothetical protein